MYNVQIWMGASSDRVLHCLSTLHLPVTDPARDAHWHAITIPVDTNLGPVHCQQYSPAQASDDSSRALTLTRGDILHKQQTSDPTSYLHHRCIRSFEQAWMILPRSAVT